MKISKIAMFVLFISVSFCKKPGSSSQITTNSDERQGSHYKPILECFNAGKTESIVLSFENETLRLNIGKSPTGQKDMTYGEDFLQPSAVEATRMPVHAKSPNGSLSMNSIKFIAANASVIVSYADGYKNNGSVSIQDKNMPFSCSDLFDLNTDGLIEFQGIIAAKGTKK